jgi:iron complex outermembrane receptor protein
MFYATASKGYKVGGKNLTPNTPDYKPETNLVYEGGWKTTIMDGRLRVNGAVFYSDYEDIQLSSLFNNLPLQQNAASGESYGAEIEVTGRFGGFGVDAGLGWLHGEFAEDTTIVNTTTNRPQLVSAIRRCTARPDYECRHRLHVLAGHVRWYRGCSGRTSTIPSCLTSPSFLSDVFDAHRDHTGRWQSLPTNFSDGSIASQIGNATSADGGIIYGTPRQYGLRLTYDMRN